MLTGRLRPDFVNTCANCGHEKQDHREDGCGSSHRSRTKDGRDLTFGVMDWCVCKKFVPWNANNLQKTSEEWSGFIRRMTLVVTRGDL